MGEAVSRAHHEAVCALHQEAVYRREAAESRAASLEYDLNEIRRQLGGAKIMLRKLTADRDAARADPAWGCGECCGKCPHPSSTGVDQAPMGPDKRWRCDACGWEFYNLDRSDGISENISPAAHDTLAALAAEIAEKDKERREIASALGHTLDGSCCMSLATHAAALKAENAGLRESLVAALPSMERDGLPKTAAMLRRLSLLPAAPEVTPEVTPEGSQPPAEGVEG